MPACWFDDTTTPCLRAGLDVDVGIDAALADELELGQPRQQRRANLGALADEDQRLGVRQALGQDVDVLGMVVPDRDVVAVELSKAGQRPHGVVIVVKNGDFHATPPAPDQTITDCRGDDSARLGVGGAQIQGRCGFWATVALEERNSAPRVSAAWPPRPPHSDYPF